MNSQVLEDSINNQAIELYFQLTGENPSAEKHMNHLMLGNLQQAFDLSKEEMTIMFAEEHYNHQY